ncbi:MarR family winged helix-turn-helix transcriptional regulator [Roseivirga sp. BDSF3-8]|uniref:MarR family winged helix-turn-helix transcriptional regulator n=1 Tax=Roseivirga sp. BDSF3-8 TaxID=3241598 RepID=UPI003531DE8F
MAIEDDIHQKKFTSEYQKLVINILYTSSWLNERQAVVFKKFGLTAAQYNVLRILRGQHPKPSTINLIIERMLDRMSNASRIVDKLERKNLVVRKQCPSDRRAVDVHISDEGLELLAKIDPVMNNWNDELSVLTEKEAGTLNELLDKVRTSTLFEEKGNKVGKGVKI